MAKVSRKNSLNNREVCGMDKYAERLKEAFSYADNHKSFNKKKLIENAKHVCVFGLGKYFEDAFVRQNVRARYNVDLLCDNDSNKLTVTSSMEKYNGLKCITVGQLKDYTNIVIIIMLGNPSSAMKQLGSIVGQVNCVAYNDLVLDDLMNEKGDGTWYSSQMDRMLEAFDLLTDSKSKEIYANIICNRIAPNLAEKSYKEMCTLPQYWGTQDLYPLTQKESIVDCGAYVGDTFLEFAEIVNYSWRKYTAFELDKENFNVLVNNTKQWENVYCHNLGVWSDNRDINYGRMSFTDSYSIFNPREQEKAKVVCIDDFMKNDTITLIKMDIEGAEMEALKGCKEIITEQRPKMAICAYHRLEDIWEIPLYLKQLVPEYNIAIRHHAEYFVAETVCYAFIGRNS